jgi:hypothetical protein
MAFEVVKAMQADNLEWDEDYGPFARAALRHGAADDDPFRHRISCGSLRQAYLLRFGAVEPAGPPVLVAAMAKLNARFGWSAPSLGLGS